MDNQSPSMLKATLIGGSVLGVVGPVGSGKSALARALLGLYSLEAGRVLLDGRPERSCMTRAIEADGRSLITVEGLAANGRVDPIQQAYMDTGAIQCGFCTPAMVLTTKALLDTTSNPGGRS